MLEQHIEELQSTKTEGEGDFLRDSCELCCICQLISQSPFWLCRPWSTRHLGVWFKYIVLHMFTYDVKVAVCDNFIRVVTEFVYKCFDCALDGGGFEILKAK